VAGGGRFKKQLATSKSPDKTTASPKKVAGGRFKEAKSYM
jgi:hypothetical protein